jgi:prolyl-tRNA synthetase
MKPNSISYSSLLLLSLLLSATGAHAQSAARANVPFAFKVGTKQMPAGTYTVMNETGTNIVMVHNVQTGTSALAMGRLEAPTKKTNKLIFRRYGSQYFLTAILGSQGSQGLVFQTTKQEQKLQEVAKASATSDNNVEIASR